ncbi:MAG: orotate phosphoribosyltransferase [Gemmatimonadota bacterium]|nr:orotate phosphoribosyltransferase [Gemmatimonadota bacterium]
MNDPSPHQRLTQLIQLLAHRSARRGQFTLSSGRTSSLYIDARLTTMSPDGLSLIGPLGLRAIEESPWAVQSIGGLTLGADPMTYAISYASALAGRPLRAFSVRKEAKTHGTGKRIEGSYSPGDRVAIIEDVITTGGSALRAAEVLQADGGQVAGILALVDREEGGREAIEAAGYPVLALITGTQVLEAMLHA